VIVDQAKQGIGISRCLDLPATFDSGRVDPSGRSRKSRRARLDRLAATIPHFSGERLRLGALRSSEFKLKSGINRVLPTGRLPFIPF
jgi:hypothetical protein